MIIHHDLVSVQQPPSSKTSFTVKCLVNPSARARISASVLSATLEIHSQFLGITKPTIPNRRKRSQVLVRYGTQKSQRFPLSLRSRALP
jgi:hypothetical protein